jgi:GH25 family lysozyme M1 (1,4-beta-N-acetylmuramidase)
VNKLPIGFYHFSDSINQVKVKQIIFWITSEINNLPLVIDVEEWGNTATKPTKDVIDEIKVFIAVVEK